MYHYPPIAEKKVLNSIKISCTQDVKIGLSSSWIMKGGSLIDGHYTSRFQM